MNNEQMNTRTPSRQPGRTGQPRQGSRNDSVRSSATKRKKKTNKRYGFIYCFLVLFVLAVGAGLSFTVIFNASSVTVENTAVRYSDEAIIKASGIAVGDNMPRMNVNSIASAIEKKLPYIGKATIKRRFPDAVVISVEYTKAAVAVENVSGYVLLDAAGKVLETGVQEPADYVAELTGVSVDEAEAGSRVKFTDADMFTYVTGLVSDFEKAGYNNLTLLDFSDMNNVSAEVDYRIVVKLGSISKASSRLNFGKKVIDENLINTASGRLVVDLTQDGKAFVRSEKNIEAAQQAAENAPESAVSEEGEPLTADEPTSAQEETQAEEAPAEVTENAAAEDDAVG